MQGNSRGGSQVASPGGRLHFAFQHTPARRHKTGNSRPSAERRVMLFDLMALARGNLALEAAGVFLLSSQAAIFGPSKYGLLQEQLPEKDLSWGNGVVELGTFLAAISATVASGFLAFYFRGHQERSGIALVGCTLFGLAASFGISRVPTANPARRFNRD